MKSKPSNSPQDDFDQDDEDDIEVDSSGPGIASAKKSKITIIALSSVFITVIIYMFFIKGDDGKKETLEPIEVPLPSVNIAPSDSGDSPFEIKEEEEESEESAEAELFEKPLAPEAPALPELSEEELAEHDFLIPQEGVTLREAENGGKKNDPKNPNINPAPINPGVNNQNPNQQNQEQAQNNQAPLPQDGQLPVAPIESAADGIDRLIEESKKELNPRYAPIIVFSGGGNSPGRGVGYEENIIDLNEDPISKLELTQPGVTATYIADRPHTIAQGKLLHAVLETAINTEIPGSVRAVVSRDVYGESGNKILIPRGSRLFGSYTSQIERGQGRVQINWARLIRPDGVDLSVSLNAADQFGRAGISGDVDNKYGSIITNSLLTSVLAVGGVAAVQALIGDNVTTTTNNAAQGTVTTTGDATNQALSDVSKAVTDTVTQVVKNAINITPVIRVPQGSRITVIVNSDIVVPNLRGDR